MTYSFWVPARQKIKKSVWVLLTLTIMLALSLLVQLAQAQEQVPENGFRPVKEWRTEAAAGLFRSFKNSIPLVGAGACYGPMFEYRAWDRWLGDFISFCGYGLGDVSNDEEKEEASSIATGGIQLFNAIGFRGSVSYDPFGNDLFWSIMISPMGTIDQLMKQ